MGEAVWPAETLKAYLATILRVVVVLLGQHEDQLKSGLPWMEAHIKPLDTFEWKDPKCMSKRVDIWT